MAIFFLSGIIASSPALAGEKMVAVIMPGGLPRHQAAHDAFAAILQAGGFGETQVKIFVQKPNPDRMSITNSIRRAVQAGADILVTYGAPTALIAKQEAKKIPVLFADVYDPVSLGIVSTLAAPGVDMTGASSTVPLEGLIEELLRITPAKRIGVLFTASEAGSALQASELERLGNKGGFTVLKQDVTTPERVANALGEVLERIDALYLTESLPLAPRTAEVLEKASARGVPVISQIPGLGSQGAVLNLEADPEEQGKLAGVHALQVLAGQKAHILAVRTPKKIALVVNRGVARQLSLTLPESLLSRADRVID